MKKISEFESAAMAAALTRSTTTTTDATSKAEKKDKDMAALAEQGTNLIDDESKYFRYLQEMASIRCGEFKSKRSESSRRVERLSSICGKDGSCEDAYGISRTRNRTKNENLESILTEISCVC